MEHLNDILSENNSLKENNSLSARFIRRRRPFHNPTTRFDPAYRNVQEELWELLTPEQQLIVAEHFRHLKNHAQIVLTEALLDYIEEGIFPYFTEEQFVCAALFVKLTGYGLVQPLPTDIRPKQEVIPETQQA